MVDLCYIRCCREFCFRFLYWLVERITEKKEARFMHAIIILCLLAADPPAPSPAPAPCPPVLTPLEAAWAKVDATHKEWFRLKAIADQAEAAVTAKQAEVDALKISSGTAAAAAQEAKKKHEDAGNAYGDIVDPESGAKKAGLQRPLE